jgi:hypothetical protein
LLHNVYDVLRVGNVIKNPGGNSELLGIEITAEPSSPGKPAEAKEVRSVDPNDPAFDPKVQGYDAFSH